MFQICFKYQEIKLENREKPNGVAQWREGGDGVGIDHSSLRKMNIPDGWNNLNSKWSLLGLETT